MLSWQALKIIKFIGKNHVHQTAINNEAMYIPWRPGAFKKARRRRMRLAWSVWCIAAVFVLFQFFLQLSSGEIISPLMHSFALSAFGGGLLASSYYYVYVLLQTPAGMLMDRYGPRGILSAGALCVCIGCLLFATAKTVLFALVGRILMGGGSAFAFVGCLNIISIWFPKRRFALMAAIVETAGMIGAIVGNFGLATCIQTAGWRHCIITAGIFAGILSLFLYGIVRNAPRIKTRSYAVAARASMWIGLKILLRNPLVWVNGVYSGLMFGVVTVFIALWAIPFFELAHHASLVQATITVSALYVGVAVGGPLLGWLDSKTRFRKPLMIFCALCASTCLFIAIFALMLPLFAIAIALFFAGIGASSYVLTFAIANEISANNRATTIGFTNMLCVLFAPILQPIVGFLIIHLHCATAVCNFQWAVSLVPVLLIFGGVLAFFLPERLCRR